LWLQLYFIVTHFAAALFCYWLCRDLGRTRAGAMLGGVAFALSGVVGAVGWPQMLNGAIWTPLIFLFFVRSSRGERPLSSAALCGTFLGISFLSGHPQIPILLAVMMAALWLFEGWRHGLRTLKPAVVFLVFAFLVSALQVLPAYEYGKLSIRWVGSQNAIFWGQSVPYSVDEQYAHSLFPLGVLGFVLPNLTPHHAFVGTAVLTLALMGFTAHFRALEVRTLGAIGAGGLLFALGGYSIFHGVAYLVMPMVEKARTPAMALTVVQFAMTVMAAYGIDTLRGGVPGRWWIPALLTAGVLPWPALAVMASLRQETSREYEHVAVLALVALSLGAVLHAWKSRLISERVVTGLLFVVVLFDLGTVTARNFRHRENPGGFLAQLESDRDVVEFLRRQPDLLRLETDTDAVPYNIGDWEGIDQFRAYLGGMTENVARFEIDRLKGGRLAPMLFALNYFLGKKPLRDGQQEVFRGESGLTVYRNPEAFPRAWTVHEASSVKSEELISQLQATDLRRRVLVSAPPPRLESCAGNDEVTVLERREAFMVLEAKLACRGMVIVSETFFPGWSANVDGRFARIFEADGVLRGVVAEGGTHRIELKYRPWSVYWGGYLSALGLTASVAITLWRSRTAS
ncbi:MAG TPA: hypothetical protein VMT32_01095, partial [Bryobacteraceae bacterium]|nr:hypothetical protein [Bryobacteraceae bacterium]